MFLEVEIFSFHRICRVFGNFTIFCKLKLSQGQAYGSNALATTISLYIDPGMLRFNSLPLTSLLHFSALLDLQIPNWFALILKKSKIRIQLDIVLKSQKTYSLSIGLTKFLHSRSYLAEVIARKWRHLT